MATNKKSKAMSFTSKSIQVQKPMQNYPPIFQ